MSERAVLQGGQKKIQQDTFYTPMNVILKEILALPGVQGTCVLDENQDVQLANLPESFNTAMATEVSSNVGRMMQMAGVKGMESQSIAINYDKFIILGLSLQDKALILILCAPGSNSALVMTTARMLAPEIEKSLQQSQEQEAATDSTGQGAATSAQVNEKTAQALDYLKQSLFETIGPIAEMIYDDCFERWTANNHADISRIFELVGCISTEMDNPELFQEFKGKIASLL